MHVKRGRHDKIRNLSSFGVSVVFPKLDDIKINKREFFAALAVSPPSLPRPSERFLPNEICSAQRTGEDRDKAHGEIKLCSNKNYGRNKSRCNGGKKLSF